MAKMVNWTQNDVNLTSFDDTCEYMFFSRYDPEMQLTFVPQDIDNAYCGAWLNGWIYETCLALDIEWQLVSYEFLNQLNEFSNYLLGKVDMVSDLSTFWKYFKIDNSLQNHKLPKYITYISHDEIMGAFFKSLTSKHV
jgi:hypothetical protein